MYKNMLLGMALRKIKKLLPVNSFAEPIVSLTIFFILTTKLQRPFGTAQGTVTVVVPLSGAEGVLRNW